MIIKWAPMRHWMQWHDLHYGSWVRCFRCVLSLMCLQMYLTICHHLGYWTVLEFRMGEVKYIRIIVNVLNKFTVLINQCTYLYVQRYLLLYRGLLLSTVSMSYYRIDKCTFICVCIANGKCLQLISWPYDWLADHVDPTP